MPSANRYENEYLGWLDGTSNRYYYESDEQRGRRRLMTTGGILAAGVLGVLAYRSGALRPLVRNLMDTAGGIRNKVDVFFDALNKPGSPVRNLSEAFAKIPKSAIAEFTVPDDPALIQMLREREDALKKVSDFLRYRSGVRPDEISDALVAAQKIIDDATADFLKYSAEAEATLFKRTGFRHLTLEEALARNFTFGDPGDIFIRQVRQMMSIDPDFGKRAIDPLIYVDAAGRIRDLRGARHMTASFVSRAANEFGVPFVGLNPLRMFYMDDLISGKYKPIIKAFGGASTQGFVTGHSKQVGSILLFANGKVFDLTGPQFDEFRQGLRSSFDPIAVNTYLLSNRGPWARTARQVMGLAQKEYQVPTSGSKRRVFNFARRLDIGFQDYLPDSKLARAIYQRISPWTLSGYKEAADLFGSTTPYVIMNRAVMPWQDTRRFFRQFVAGRHDMRNFTTLSMFPYMFMERLARGLGRVGLGFRPENLGSATQIFGALMTKRVLPVMLGIYAWKYLDYEMENLTGEGLNSRIADAWAGAMIDVAKVSEWTGLHKRAKRAKYIFPGGEQITELPIIRSLPHLDKTEEEMRYWLEHGEVPIRRGRFWSFNNTPFTGGRIDRFEPNWYRQVKSDWQYTDTLYGSKREFWENAPIPTPRHPLAPIRHFITDPYHWEKKHYHDRPYLITGGFPEIEEIPIIGPAMGSIVSAILKPRRKMHPEVWAALQAGNTTRTGLKSPDAVKSHLVSNDPTGAEEGGEVAGGSSSGEVVYDEHGRPILRPGSGREVAWRTWANIKDMAGFYGFAPTIITGRESEPAVIADSRAITSYRRQFWEQDIGGLGGDTSEIGRRLIGKREKWEDRFNPIRNTMPEWLPGKEGFIDFQHGDPYVKIKRGEIRLPGAAHESLYNIPEVQEALRHEEIRQALARGDLHWGDLYGPLTRFRILADVAPYSEEFKEVSRIIANSKLTEEEKREVREIRQQIRMQSKPLRVYPYRFKNLNTEVQTVHITKVIDNNIFLTEEYPHNPIRLAGVRARVGQSEEAVAAANLLAKYIAKGKAVKIEFDPTLMISDDTYHTIRAVVYSDGVNVNRLLLEQGLAKERVNDFSPAAVKARFSPEEIVVGALWETFAHLDTPIHTKVLQVRSPLESYERRDLYGKDFQKWEDPISDFLVPTWESTIRRSVPLAIAAGVLLGRLFGTTRAGKLIGGLLGGTLAGAGSLYINTREFLTGEEFIPARRRKEWATEEYFDLLKYVKSMRLFYQEAELAREKEGFDVEQYIKERSLERKRRLAERERLEDYKRRVYTSLDPDYWREVARELGIDAESEKELKREINRRINETRQAPPEPELGYHSTMALRHYAAARRTMYGSQPGDPVQDIIRALPRKFRNYYEYFTDATDEERERIREIVPDFFLRALQPAWGEEPLPKESLEELFARYYLPGPEWAGWRPDVNLDAVRVKFVEKSGQDRSEFNIWPEDVLMAQQVDVPVPRAFVTDDTVEEVRRKLKRLLGRAEARNLEISVQPQRSGFDIDIETEEDMDDRLRYALNTYPW